MQINISVLSKSESTEFFKALPIASLRELAISDNKLAKKYILGFRPANAPINMLATMYSQEIHANNQSVKDRLQEIWDEYAEKIHLNEWLQQVTEVDTVEAYIKIGSEYAKLNTGLKVSLLCKVLELEIEPQKIASIQRCVDEFTAYMDAMGEELKSIEQKHEQDIKVLDKLNREKDFAEKNRDAAVRNLEKYKNDSERELQKLRGELLMCQDKSIALDERVKELAVLAEERSLKIEELDKIRLRLEETMRLLKEDVAKKEKENQTVHAELEEVLEEKSMLQNERELKYRETIQRLIEGTIADLKIDYSLDIKQIDEIMDKIDGEHDIISVWKHLSALNLERLVDVEISMSNDLVDMEVLDVCDEIENNILLKYIILKSVKSLLFEFMSEKEKTVSMAKKISDCKK